MECQYPGALPARQRGADLSGQVFTGRADCQPQNRFMRKSRGNIQLSGKRQTIQTERLHDAVHWRFYQALPLACPGAKEQKCKILWALRAGQKK